MQQTPSINEYLNVANYTYYQGTGSVPTGLTPLMSNGQDVEKYDAAAGFYGQAFVTSQNQVIVGFEGTNFFTAELTPSPPTAAQFTAGQVIDDANIYAGINAPSYQVALQFTQTAIAAAAAQNISTSTGNVFLAGHSLGAADAEYVATQTGLGGTTFGAPGIPAADIGSKSSQLTNYVVSSDPIGNYYSGSALGSIVNNSAILHFGGSSVLDTGLGFLLSDAGEDFALGTKADLAAAAGDLAVALPTHSLSVYASFFQGSSLSNPDLSLGGAPLCFAAGSSILTTRGKIPVEALRIGMEVITAFGKTRPICWLGFREIDCAAQRIPSRVWPVRIRAGAFGGGFPESDLYLSPGHPVLVADHLVPIMCLINGTTIERAPVNEITYWHVELEQHDILLAEGLPAESYIDLGSRPWFAAVDGALYDPDMAMPEMPGRCRPVAIDGPVVEGERRRLDAVFAMRLAGACAWPSTEDAFLTF